MVRELKSECEALRSSLHRIPETGYTEYKTQAYLTGYIEKLHPDKLVRIAGTGVKAVFYAKKPELTIAVRADIDALEVFERTGLPFASEHEDRMHACGHDGHMTAALLAAKLVSEHRETMKHNAVFLFQPAEEGLGGAYRMIEEGALTDPRVDEIYGLHVWPDVPCGRIGIREGSLMAKASEFILTVNGKSAHGAAPHKGVDAIAAAAYLVGMLQTVISRSSDPCESAVVTVGRINGGTAHNVIADRAVLNGTIRAFSDETGNLIKERIGNILKGADAAFGTVSDITYKSEYACVENPKCLADKLRGLLDPGDEYFAAVTATAEDFSAYQKIVPGLFFFLGVGGDIPLHNSRFYFDSELLLYGVESYRRLLGIS
jgi:amidohydrolase